MLVLAIDTATAQLVVGLVETGTGTDTDTDTDTVLAESVETTRAHNERLVPTVDAVLAEAGRTYGDLDAIVVGCGPGPFTGLRVGMASASAFGQALGIPVHGVVTHDASSALIDAPSTLIATDARRREVYWAHYVDGERVAGPEVCAPSAIPVEEVDVLSVPEHLADQLTVRAREVTYVAPRPEGLVRVADLNSASAPLVPHYLRRPDAVEPAPKPKSSALPDVHEI